MIFSDKAMRLYDEIKDKTINDCYARPELSFTGKITNGWDLICDEWKTGWLDLCGVDIEKLSDFEKLSAWIEAVRLMPDNALKLIFDEEVEALLGANGCGTEPASFWKTTAEMLLDKNNAVEKILRDNNANLMNFSEKSILVGGYTTNCIVDINREISALTLDGATLDFGEWSEGLISRLKEKKPPYVLAADIKDMGFVRGDHYHAGQAYGKIKQGEAISGEEKSQLFFWLLADICTKLGGNCLLHLNIGENYVAALLLISYLTMRGICPNIRIGVSPEASRLGSRLCELCRLDSQRISLELVLGVEDTPRSFSQRMEELLAFYPASKLKFGGVLTDSKLCFAAHRYARKVICQAISEISDDNAESIVKAIFS